MKHGVVELQSCDYNAGFLSVEEMRIKQGFFVPLCRMNYYVVLFLKMSVVALVLSQRNVHTLAEVMIVV